MTTTSASAEKSHTVRDILIGAAITLIASVLVTILANTLTVNESKVAFLRDQRVTAYGAYVDQMLLVAKTKGDVLNTLSADSTIFVGDVEEGLAAIEDEMASLDAARTQVLIVGSEGVRHSANEAFHGYEATRAAFITVLGEIDGYQDTLYDDDYSTLRDIVKCTGGSRKDAFISEIQVDLGASNGPAAARVDCEDNIDRYSDINEEG
jgi:hypothetical protein